MNSNLEVLLLNFSNVAFCLALIFAAFACRRLRLAGSDKAFGIAAWLAFIDLAVYGGAYLADWRVILAGDSWNNPALVSKVMPWIDHGYQISDFLHLLFTAVLASGFIRSARRLLPKSA